MLKHCPALPSLGPWQRIKNTPLVLLTLFKFPASKRPIPAVDQQTHYYWMPLALQVITTLQMDCDSALWKSALRGRDTRRQYLPIQFSSMRELCVVSPALPELQSPVRPAQSPQWLRARLPGTWNKYLRLVCLRRKGVLANKNKTTLSESLLVVL